LANGYYSAYIYELKKSNWTKYGELVFSIKNESKDPLKFNVIVERESGESLTILENSQVFIQKKGEEKLDIISPTFGSIELEGHFDGTVHIPFNSLQDKNLTEFPKEQQISQIISWGITTNIVENKELEFRVEDFELVLKENALLNNKLAGIIINGDKQVLKPIVGESIAQYSVEMNGMNERASFQLDKPINGAILTDDGRLTLTPSIQTDKLLIQVEIDNKWRKQFNVELTTPWSLNAKDKDGTSLAIPKIGEMAKVTNSSDPFLNKNTLIALRMIILTGGAIICLLYWGWRRRARGV